MAKHLFSDRTQAGQQLAKALLKFAPQHPLVLALPRGGVPVAYEIAKKLHVPLSAVIVRKVGAPWNPELGIAAVTEKGIVVYDQAALKRLHLSATNLIPAVDRELAEVARRVRLYRGAAHLPVINNRTVILVDDGVARGMTATAAIAFLRRLKPKTLVFAAPVCAADSAKKLRTLADDTVFLKTPTDLGAIGLWYRDFAQVNDEEVQQLLLAGKVS